MPLALPDRFTQAFSILKSLTQDRDAVIFSVNRFVRAEVCSGAFEACASEPMSLAFGSLTQPLTLKTGSIVVVEIDEDAREKLKLPDFPDGALALICLGTEGETLFGAAIFESRKNGGLSPDSISALKSTARLVSERSPRRETSQVQNFYRRLAIATHQCFWVIDLETTRVLNVSDNFEDVWGAERSILSADSSLTGFLANILTEDRDRVQAEFHLRLEGDLDLTFRILDQGGEIRWLRLRSSSLEDDGPRPSRLLLLMADDVTDTREVIERERTQDAALVARARALAVVDLASGVAHEINNPLTIIVGRASELKRQLMSTDVSKDMLLEFAEKIQTTALRIANIVKSLKSLAKQDRGEGFVKTDFKSLAVEVLDLCAEKFKDHGVRLEIEPPHQGLSCDMNPTLISQVILNLVNNALDAVSDLNERWVTVDFSDDTDSVYIGVTDSGSGIPLKLRSRIFDPFFTTKDPGKGTGLGLSLSNSIAAHHNGALRLDTLHAHTRFVLQIPKTQISIQKLKKAA